jgi:hypothetical protein
VAISAERARSFECFYRLTELAQGILLSSMDNLVPPDLHYASAALGWLELGNSEEAKVELGHISDTLQNHPVVLEIRWGLCVKGEQWEDGLEVAREMMRAAPEISAGWLHHSYALRRAKGGGVKKAWAALLPAFDLFPKDETICYNLACYACQLELLDAARVWFKRAMVLGEKDTIRQMALDDPDLQALWCEIKQLR